MFNICKCNQFHFLYANAVSLLLAKMTRIPVNWEAAFATAVNNPDKFLYREQTHNINRRQIIGSFIRSQCFL